MSEKGADAIARFKALENLMGQCAVIIDELGYTEFSTLSFLGCEKDLNDALGYHGNKSWNDMIKEVKTLKTACTKNI